MNTIDLETLEREMDLPVYKGRLIGLEEHLPALVAELRASRRVVEAARAVLDDIVEADAKSEVPIEYNNQAWLRAALAALDTDGL